MSLFLLVTLVTSASADDFPASEVAVEYVTVAEAVVPDFDVICESDTVDETVDVDWVDGSP